MLSGCKRAHVGCYAICKKNLGQLFYNTIKLVLCDFQTPLRNVLRALTLTYPNEFRSVAEGYDRPVSEYLPVRDWGRPGNIRRSVELSQLDD